MALFIDPHFYFWKIEIQRVMLEPLLPQQGSEFPGKMEPFAQLITRWGRQDSVGLFVGKPVRAANHTVCKARAFHHSIFIEMNKDGMCEPIDSWVKTANAVA